MDEILLGKGRNMKARMPESMKIQVRNEGYDKYSGLEFEMQGGNMKQKGA